MVADHLSGITPPSEGSEGRSFDEPIRGEFPDEQLFALRDEQPWYAYIVNFLVTNRFPPRFTKVQQSRLKNDAKRYVWDDPYLWKQGADLLIRRCIPDFEVRSILHSCHSFLFGGHFGPKRTARKVFDSGFFWPHINRDA